jgi:peptidoglycan/xylan/chitin deacetylase (PgdA/CDA1 family)
MSLIANAPIPASDLGRRVVVLVYHSIHPSKTFASATPESFEEQMVWLQEQCDVIPLEEVLTVAAGPHRSRPSVAITFDDGYADVFEHAMPVLTRLHLPATVFLMTDLIEGQPREIVRMARLQAARTAEVVGMTWTQVYEMRDEGIRFGSHGVSHVNLAQADDRTVQHEATASKERLEEKLGIAINTFAYPFGRPGRDFTPRTMRLVASCGYRRACTVNYRRVRPREHPMAIPRFAVTMDPLSMLEAKINGRLDLVGWYQEHAPVWVRRLLTPDEDAGNHLERSP